MNQLINQKKSNNQAKELKRLSNILPIMFTNMLTEDFSKEIKLLISL